MTKVPCRRKHLFEGLLIVPEGESVTVMVESMAEGRQALH